MSNTPQPIKIVVADDHQLFADGLEQLLLTLRDSTVIGKVKDGKSLMRFLNRSTPDLILMDINMPQMDGLTTAKEIRTLFPAIKIIFITMYYDPNIISICKEQGVHGYVTKDTTADVMKEAITAVMAGGTVYLDKETQMEPKNAFRDDDFIQKFKLSPRELEIIGQIKTGATSKQIAEQLGLSELTIETHRKNIFRKLGFRSMADLIRFACEQGL
jgi:DNA-binding NarL/FixJ family response regulator